jgi:type IV secretion system protein VirD4
MTRLEAIQLGVDQRGDGNKLCPYVGGLADGSGPGDTATMIYARSASYAPGQDYSELRDGSGHLLTVAPTRAGKGTGQIIPNLLRWTGSCIVIDVKGENYLRTAGFRH